MKQNVLDALNKQIQQELTAAYHYLGLSVWFDQQVLKGFSKYFFHQMKEEQEHAEKLLEFVQDRGGAVQLGTINAPPVQFPSVLDAVKSAQTAERNNTASIHALYQLAVKEGDLATQEHLNWFIKEQVEEEKWADELVTLCEKIANHTGALFMLDHRVGKRTEAEEGD